MVGVAVFSFLRFRNGATIHIPMRFLLQLYLYVIIIVGLLIFTPGASSLIRAGAAGIGVNDFSYNPVYVALPGSQVARTPEPLELKDQSLLSEEEREELSQLIAEREQRQIELDQERRRLGLDRRWTRG